jgi:hypothetical protein
MYLRAGLNEAATGSSRASIAGVRPRTLEWRPMTWKQLCKLGRALPEVVEDVWYGTPALKVRKKAFVRLRESGKDVVFMLESVEEQEALIHSFPAVYYITDHYRGYPAVLARLAALRVPECHVRLERGWRLKAPAALVKKLDAG